LTGLDGAFSKPGAETGFRLASDTRTIHRFLISVVEDADSQCGPGRLHASDDLTEPLSYSCPVYLQEKLPLNNVAGIEFAWTAPACGCVKIKADVLDEEGNLFTPDQDQYKDLSYIACVSDEEFDYELTDDIVGEDDVAQSLDDLLVQGLDHIMTEVDYDLVLDYLSQPDDDESESSGLLPKDDNEGDADNKDDNDDNDIDVDDEVAVDPVQGEDEHVVADLETVISPIKVQKRIGKKGMKGWRGKKGKRRHHQKNGRGGRSKPGVGGRWKQGNRRGGGQSKQGKKWCCRQGKQFAKMNDMATCEDNIPEQVLEFAKFKFGIDTKTCDTTYARCCSAAKTKGVKSVRNRIKVLHKLRRLQRMKKIQKKQRKIKREERRRRRADNN